MGLHMILTGYFLGTLLRDKLGINLDEHIEVGNNRRDLAIVNPGDL